jgi:hypothetical protein
MTRQVYYLRAAISDHIKAEIFDMKTAGARTLFYIMKFLEWRMKLLKKKRENTAS